MSLHGLVKYLSDKPDLQGARAKCQTLKPGKTLLFGCRGSLKSAAVAAVAEKINAPSLVIAADQDEAYVLTRELKALLVKERDVRSFPAPDTIPFERHSPSKDIIGERLETLSSLLNGETPVIVSTLKAVISRTIPPRALKDSRLSFKAGSKLSLDELLRKLVSMGFVREDVVGERGEMSLRGSILDIFPSNGAHPIRLDLLGDEIESIREFDVASQRSISRRKNALILPPREAVIDKSAMKRIKRAGRADKGAQEILNKGYFDGIEYYLPLLYEGLYTVFDYIPDKSLVVTADEISMDVLYKHLEREAEQARADEEILRGEKVNRTYSPYLAFGRLKRLLEKRHILEMPALTSLPPSQRENVFSLQASPAYDHFKDLDVIEEELRAASHERAVIVSRQAHRIVEVLRERGLASAFTEALEDIPKIGITVVKGELFRGFRFEDRKLLVLTDTEFFGIHPQNVDLKSLPEEGIDRSLLADINFADFVVHENHGIGIFRGLENLEIDSVNQEYLLIEYAAEDKLYVPVSQMGLVQKYNAVGDHAPKVNRLSSVEWSRIKSRAAKSIEDLTEELLELYSVREASKGFAFPSDSVWQAELEGGFPYEETEDQKKAIADVKRDMEDERPMDRLICGDVGYGKTEVALRAAFKAAAAGKQVVLLCPTTILAEQHYNNFKERFAPFPVKVEMLSRFKTKEEQRRIIEDLALGSTDIVIGTHRLIQSDVNFKDLGLLIIDEEQRFGVAHKERLKKLKKSVDVITLTATPIPRTLYMSLSGVRDMSMIATPPLDRAAVKTYILEWSREAVREAISRELERGGQVYYVHNWVEDINAVAKDIQDLMPLARIAVAHGQMEGGKLEKTMIDFMKRAYDILVCTTIIESGIDIPNVNTIIIDRVGRFGLSQLYQLRGRVGRSSTHAFAYLLYRKDELLTSMALERIKAISEFTVLGSGYRLALRDLEIRGAGNLLGRQQHGHMLAVGFDLYCDLIKQAAGNVRGTTEVSPKDIIIDIKTDAYIPDAYISDERQRISYYRRLNLISDVKAVNDVKDEIVDRFGPYPKEVRRLFRLIELKVKASLAGIKKIEEKGHVFTVDFFEAQKEEALKKSLRSRAAAVGISAAKMSFTISGGDKLKVIEDIVHKLYLPLQLC